MGCNLQMFLVKPRFVNQQRNLFFDVLCGQTQDAAPHTVKTEDCPGSLSFAL